MTKKDELLFWCKSMTNPFSSVHVINWGVNNYYSRARRTIQEFALDPAIPIKRIPDGEAILRGLVKSGRAKLAFYEVGVLNATS